MCQSITHYNHENMNCCTAILTQLLEYARGEQEMSICALLSKKISVSIRFTPFDFRCRMLTLFVSLEEIDNEAEVL